MQPLENYSLKRKNFVEKCQSVFYFLIDEMKYYPPEVIQEEYSDHVSYINVQGTRWLTFSNAYHPSDHGFTFRIAKVENGILLQEVTALYLLKEEQDTDQSFLLEAREAALKSLHSIIAGESWFNENWKAIRLG